MPNLNSGPSTQFDKQEIFRKHAHVIVIDDRCGDLSQPGDMTNELCKRWAKSSTLVHVKDIQGDTPQEKIEDFRRKLFAALGSDFEVQNSVVVLDRDLGIGKLPLSSDALKSQAAHIDDCNDGPALVPHIRSWLPNAVIVGFTGEGDTTGMTELYGGARVVQKPHYDRLKENLTDAFAEAHGDRADLTGATLPPPEQA